MELFGEYKELHLTEQRWFDGQWVPRPTLEKFGVLEPEWVEEPGGGGVALCELFPQRRLLDAGADAVAEIPRHSSEALE